MHKGRALKTLISISILTFMAFTIAITGKENKVKEDISVSNNSAEQLIVEDINADNSDNLNSEDICIDNKVQEQSYDIADTYSIDYSVIKQLLDTELLRNRFNADELYTIELRQDEYGKYIEVSGNNKLDYDSEHYWPVYRMKVKYIGPTCVSLINNKEYEVLSIENGCYRIFDETEEDYLFMAEEFVTVEE